jgi:hypothetical protein
MVLFALMCICREHLLEQEGCGCEENEIADGNLP